MEKKHLKKLALLGIAAGLVGGVDKAEASMDQNDTVLLAHGCGKSGCSGQKLGSTQNNPLASDDEGKLVNPNGCQTKSSCTAKSGCHNPDGTPKQDSSVKKDTMMKQDNMMKQAK